MTNLETIEGDAESIPLPDASVDVVTINGVLSLVSDGPSAIAEICRVLKPGGRLLRRSGWLRDDLRPIWLALGSAVFAVVTTRISLVGIYLPVGWWSNAGVAGLAGASVWSFHLARQPNDCVDEMVREEQWRQPFGSPAPRLAIGTLASALAAANLYGLSVSVTALTQP